MALELDTRQRAMLQEMGVHVWLPESGVAVLEQAASLPAVVPNRKPVTPSVAATASASPAPAAPAMPVRAPEVAARPPLPQTAPATRAGDASLDWDSLTDAVRNCQACGLCAGRTQTTLLPPTENLSQCDWMVVGDAPDDDEDRAGAPFAGQDGVLLDNMLRALGLQQANPLPPAVAGSAAAVGAERRAYVTNVLKCRPAHGAVPQAAELAQCAAHLQSEIALVQPRIILAMGRFANQLLLGASPALATLPLGKLRGAVHSYQGTPVVVTYHPKLLMRNSADKAKAWADLCLAAATLET